MPFGDVYYQQAALLIRAIPHVAQEICFALKGGTAINLFIRNMPRLSVDLDLTYLPVEPRPESLAILEAVNILMANGDFTAIWSTLSRRGEDIYGERDPVSPGSGRQVDIRRLFRGHEVATTRLSGTFKPPSKRFSTVCQPSTPSNWPRK